MYEVDDTPKEMKLYIWHIEPDGERAVAIAVAPSIEEAYGLLMVEKSHEFHSPYKFSDAISGEPDEVYDLPAATCVWMQSDA